MKYFCAYSNDGNRMDGQFRAPGVPECGAQAPGGGPRGYSGQGETRDPRAENLPLDRYFESIGVQDREAGGRRSRCGAKKQGKQKSPFRRVVEFVVTVAICFVIAFLITRFVVQRNTVKGTSMWPTLAPRDEIFVEKISRLFQGTLHRGNIVTADTHRKTADGTEMIIIKRIVGLPGERVKIENGWVYIDGRKLEEPYLPESVRTFQHKNEFAELTLGEDEYFLLGDNRENSQDSRDIGPVSRQEIEGRMLLRFFPFSRFGVPE